MLFHAHIRLRGGLAPRAPLPAEAHRSRVEGTISPGKVFNLDCRLIEVAEDYRAMDTSIAL